MVLPFSLFRTAPFAASMAVEKTGDDRTALVRAGTHVEDGRTNLCCSARNASSRAGEERLARSLREVDRGEAVLRSDMPHRARRRVDPQTKGNVKPHWPGQHRFPRRGSHRSADRPGEQRPDSPTASAFRWGTRSNIATGRWQPGHATESGMFPQDRNNVRTAKLDAALLRAASPYRKIGGHPPAHPSATWVAGQASAGRALSRRGTMTSPSSRER